MLYHPDCMHPQWGTLPILTHGAGKVGEGGDYSGGGYWGWGRTVSRWPSPGWVNTGGKEGRNPQSMGGHDPQPSFLPEVWPRVHEVVARPVPGSSLGGLGVLRYVQNFPAGYRHRQRGQGRPWSMPGYLVLLYLLAHQGGARQQPPVSLWAPAHRCPDQRQ